MTVQNICMGNTAIFFFLSFIFFFFCFFFGLMILMLIYLHSLFNLSCHNFVVIQGIDLTQSTTATLAEECAMSKRGLTNEITSLVTAIPNQGVLYPYQKTPIFFRFSPRSVLLLFIFFFLGFPFVFSGKNILYICSFFFFILCYPPNEKL